MTEHSFDLIVIGASAAGVFAAREFARRGLRVCVFEKQRSTDAYKVMCSHILHPNVVRELEHSGLWQELQDAGAQKTRLEIRIPGSGQLHWPLSGKASFANVQRRILDPVLRASLRSTGGIDVRYGHTVEALVRTDDGRITGIRARDPQGQSHTVLAPLTLAADGVGSRVARWVNARQRRLDNGRVGLFAYYKANEPHTTTRIWALDGGETYIGFVPNGDRVILNAYLPRSVYQEYRKDLESCFQEQVIKRLEAEGFGVGERLSPLYVAQRTATSWRQSHSPGLLLIGDARLSADVMTGVGCSWALSSAQLLARMVAPALRARRDGRSGADWRLAWALRRYQWRFVLRYGPAAALIAWSSTRLGLVLRSAWIGRVASLQSRRHRRNPCGVAS